MRQVRVVVLGRCIVLAAAVFGATSSTIAAHIDDSSVVPDSLKRFVADSKSSDAAVKARAETFLRQHEKSLIQGLVFARSDTAIEQLRYIEGPRTATSDGAAKLDVPDKVKKHLVNLGSSYPVVRKWAAWNLGELGPEAVPAIPFLLDALEDDEYEADHPDDMVEQVCSAAQSALKRLGEPAVDALIERLDSHKVQARERAAQLLGDMCVERAVPSLLAVLKREDVKEVWGTIEALDELDAKEAVEPLIGLLTCDDRKTRARAVSALERFGDPRANKPLEEMAIRDEELGWSATVSLCRINENGRDATIELLKHKDSRVRRSAAYALSRYKVLKAVGPLVDALGDKAIREGVDNFDWIVEQRGVEVAVRAFAMTEPGDTCRRAALREILRYQPPETVECLLEALDDRGYEFRRFVIPAAAKVRAKEVVDRLIEIVKTAEFNGDRFEAAEALGKIGDRRAFDALAGALRDPDSLVRIYAARALVRLGDPRAVTPLLNLLAEDHRDTRVAAANALAEFDDPRVGPALIKAAGHPDEETRGWVLLALAKVDAPGVLDTLIKALEDKSVRSYACAALARRNEPRIPELVHATLGPQDATKAIESIRRIRNNIKQEELRRQRRPAAP
jgi:HEAT repeat protein